MNLVCHELQKKKDFMSDLRLMCALPSKIGSKWLCSIQALLIASFSLQIYVFLWIFCYFVSSLLVSKSFNKRHSSGLIHEAFSRTANFYSNLCMFWFYFILTSNYIFSMKRILWGIFQLRFWRNEYYHQKESQNVLQSKSLFNIYNIWIYLLLFISSVKLY